MTRILRLSRNVPSMVRLSNAHLPGAASCATDQPRVTRAEISHLFREELGYARRSSLAG